MNIKRNIYSKPEFKENIPEVFETLLKTKDVLIERIITNGAIKTPGEWYDQEKDEWVILLQGTAKLEFKNDEIVSLKKGDYIFIPSHKVHRVRQTSKYPNCIWLAFHAKLKKN